MTDAYDVVVLGTGAAGLMAAVSASDHGASVAVFEKASRAGGSTALSSGIIWLPANKYATEVGYADSRDEAVAYLRSISLGTARDELIEAFVDTVPELIGYLETKTPLQLRLVPRFPDYHPERPGGRPRGGRSLEAELFPMDELGEWRNRLAGTARPTRFVETAHGGDDVLSPEVREQRCADHVEGLGRSLVGALLKGCLDRGVLVSLAAPATDITTAPTGGLTVTVGENGVARTVTARAVVLGTGGFESSDDLRRAFLRGPVARVPGAPTNTGDGLRMAMSLGAALDCMPYASWMPVAEVPDPAAGQSALRLVLRERVLPGSILVNNAGRRFANEASCYNALGGSLHNFDTATFDFPNARCWLVFDQQYLRRYGFFDEAAGATSVPCAYSAATLAELAEQIGVPAETLMDTIERWNDGVADGIDRDFGRGRSVWDGWDGERSAFGTPQATLGRIAAAPFFAVAIEASTLGTKGGPRTDRDGRVLRPDGSVIAGLFAAGNAMAAPTGIGYGGAGGTLGPALVFGYRAGIAAAHNSTR